MPAPKRPVLISTLLVCLVIVAVVIVVSLVLHYTRKRSCTKQRLSNYCAAPGTASGVARPTTRAELGAIVERATRENRKVRCIGTFYSCPALVCRASDGEPPFLVDMTGLDRILWIGEDSFRAEAGIRLGRLCEELARRNLELETQPQTLGPTLGGCVATATHGAAVGCGTPASMSESVLELELVSSGGWRRLTESDGELFRAATMNLGAMGAVYALTLRCRPLRPSMRHIFQLDPLDEALAKLLREPPDANVIFWNVGSPRQESLTLRWVPVPETDRTTASAKREWSESCQPPTLVDLATGLLRYVPAKLWYGTVVPLAMRAMLRLSGGRVLSYALGDGNNLSALCPGEEFFVPVENLPAALHVLLETVEEHPRMRILAVALRRLTARRQTPLSPCGGKPGAQRVAIAAIAAQSNASQRQSFFSALETALLPLGGRPHWAKMNTMTPEKTLVAYGSDELNAWLRARRALDPRGMFTSELVSERILGSDNDRL